MSLLTDYHLPTNGVSYVPRHSKRVTGEPLLVRLVGGGRGAAARSIALSSSSKRTSGSWTTTIAYSLNDTADVEIQVVDVLGRLVATLVAEMQEAGSYQTEFDGSRLARGTYFYRLRANHQGHTGRITLAR